MSKPQIISGFQGEYRFLSNFHPCSITIVGIPYKSVEAAYQASKFPSVETRRHFSYLNAKEAKAKGRTMMLSRDWDDMAKITSMELCLRAKFLIPDLRARLISTAPLEMIETNNWGDKFWGVCNGSGRNVMGKLLMNLRSELIDYEQVVIDDNDKTIPF